MEVLRAVKKARISLGCTLSIEVYFILFFVFFCCELFLFERASNASAEGESRRKQRSSFLKNPVQAVNSVANWDLNELNTK